MAVVALAVAALWAGPAFAGDLRILDKAGLVRAVRVVGGSATVMVIVEGRRGEKGECVAANVDGLASEKREPLSPRGECVFKELAAGTWQVTVPGDARWRVQIND